MPDTGWLLPDTVTDDASHGAVAWSTPGNAAASDDVYATYTSPDAIIGSSPTPSHTTTENAVWSMTATTWATFSIFASHVMKPSASDEFFLGTLVHLGEARS
jgi:hypothetical protein